ncbi:hypothetical protein V8E36_007225 [Tilletia maclaganii]
MSLNAVPMDGISTSSAANDHHDGHQQRSSTSPKRASTSTAPSPDLASALETVTTSMSPGDQSQQASSSSNTSISAMARAISPPTPAPSPQPTSNALRLAQAHAHARAMAAAVDGSGGPSSALAHSFTAMPSTPPHQEDAKLAPVPGSAGLAAATSSPADLITIGSERNERSLESLQAHLVSVFPSLSRTDRLSFLSALVPLSTARELAHLQNLIIPNLKVDFLSALPYELSLHILSFIDDPVTLARCSAVSRHWRALVNDEGTWMAMCKKHGRGRSLVPAIGSRRAVSFGNFGVKGPSPQSFSYKQHIKLSYLTDSNWRRGGRLLTQHQSLTSQTVTSLAVDRDWIVVGMASSKIHVFDARTGLYYCTLRGHGTGVWALAMVSGSRRRDSIKVAEAVPTIKTELSQLDVDHEDSKEFIDGDGDTPMGDAPKAERRFSKSRSAYSGRSEKGKRKSSDWPDAQDAESGSGSASLRVKQEPGTDSLTGESLPAGRLNSERTYRVKLEPGTESSGTDLGSGSGSTSLPSAVAGSSSSNRYTKNRIDQARSAAELVKIVAAGNAAAAARDAAAGSSSSRTASAGIEGLFERGSGLRPRDRQGSSGTADGSSSQSSFYEEADSSSMSGASSISSSVALGTVSASSSSRLGGGGGGGAGQASSSSRRGGGGLGERNYPYSIVGDDELNLAYYDGLPCEDMDSLYAAADDAYAESHPLLASLGSPRVRSEQQQQQQRDQQQQRSGGYLGSSLFAGIGLGASGSGSGGGSGGGGFREGGARAVSASASTTTPQGQTGSTSSSLLPAVGNTANAYVGGLLGLFAGGEHGTGGALGGGGGGLGETGGPRYGHLARQERESPSSRHSGQRVSFGLPPVAPANRTGSSSTSSSTSASAPTWSSPRRSVPANAGERLGLGYPSSSSSSQQQQQQQQHEDTSSASIFSFDEEDAAEAKAAWNMAGLPRTGNAVGLGNPCGSSAGYGNEDAIIVSGSCDRDVRVWDLKTKRCNFVLSGHTSTVRCLKVLDGRPIAISGSRDHSLRIWDLKTGQLRHLCSGHTESVRCLEAAGNRVVSGSYDHTCRIWNVETGQCLHVLEGHHHYIYTVAFDGRRVATGSLDTTIRVWDAENGTCLSLFTGHTSLVGHLQLRDDVLVSGGSDGRVIVFSLRTNECIHRLCAHDNSVTSLQFDDRFIVTGANDGRVKVWDFRTGLLLRELVDVTPGAVVWKVSFKDDKVVALYTRDDKTIMDIISFRPVANA